MAARLVRVDLSDGARDFRAVAVELGVPMLDQANMHAGILRSWLGRFAAQPKLERTAVRFHVADEQSVRGKEAVCRPVTLRRLHGALRAEVAELRQQLEKVRPASQTEQTLHRNLTEALRNLTSDPSRSDVGCFFLECKDAAGKWRLVWCWGYQRNDRQPAWGAICTNPNCRLLYVHRRGYRAACPICQPELAGQKALPISGKWAALLAAIVLLLAALGYWSSRRGPDGGEVVAAAKAHLEVAPDPLTLWTGESGSLRSVKLVEEEGKPPQTIAYKLSAPPDQEIVAIEKEKTIRGLAKGTAKVTVTAVNPGGPDDKLTSSVTVRVTPVEKLSIEPATISLKVGDATPPLKVMAQGEDTPAQKVSAKLESMDQDILVADSRFPDQFVAKAYGGTQVRAAFGQQEAFADVTVTGQRFQEVKTELQEGDRDFEVAIQASASASEGPLEYRVYQADETPPETWVPAQQQGDVERVSLQSPRIPYGPPSVRYRLIIEARDVGGKSIEKYPFTFRLKPRLVRTDGAP